MMQVSNSYIFFQGWDKMDWHKAAHPDSHANPLHPEKIMKMKLELAALNFKEKIFGALSEADKRRHAYLLIQLNIKY